MYSPSSSRGVEAADNQSYTSWQNNRSYMGPLTLVDLPSYWEILILVQIMGIIHYLFIAGQEDENAYLTVAHKNAVPHPVTIWTVKDKLT